MKLEKRILKDIYGFDFPDDFFAIYELAQQKPNYFKGGLAGYESPLGIHLGSVFDVFKEKNDFKKSHHLKTDRYYNDPPEFFTLMSGDSDGLHWGYYVDAPNELPPIISSYYSNDAFELSYNGKTLFEMLRFELESQVMGALDTLNDPEYESERYLEDLDEMRDELKKYSTENKSEVGEEYFDKYHNNPRIEMPQTRCGMGINIPKSTYKASSELDKFQIWNYEPDRDEILRLENDCKQLLEENMPGNLLKLGKDLWIYKEFRAISYAALEKSYQALGRNSLLKTLNVAKEWRIECDKNSNID